MNLYDYFELVRGWAHARNLIEGSNPKAQILKTFSEFGELADGVNKGRKGEIEDGIGDTTVTLVIIAEQLGLPHGAITVPPYDFTMSPIDHVLNIASCLGVLADGLVNEEINHEPDDHIAIVTEILMHLNLLATACETSYVDCMAVAWNEIKDRKGRMVNGVFIKEGDVEKGVTQAELDRVMLEHCPDEMSDTQVGEWGRNQLAVDATPSHQV